MHVQNHENLYLVYNPQIYFTLWACSIGPSDNDSGLILLKWESEEPLYESKIDTGWL